MQLLPADTMAMRLVRVCRELHADDHPNPHADRVDGWLRCAGISWRELLDWITERAVPEAEAEARATPAGDRLWAWVTLFWRLVPQAEELLNRLEDVLETHRVEARIAAGGSEVLDWWSSEKSVAALQRALQRAADGGVCQDDLELFVQFWADARRVALAFDRTSPGAVTLTVRW